MYNVYIENELAIINEFKTEKLEEVQEALKDLMFHELTLKNYSDLIEKRKLEIIKKFIQPVAHGKVKRAIITYIE